MVIKLTKMKCQLIVIAVYETFYINMKWFLSEQVGELISNDLLYRR